MTHTRSTKEELESRHEEAADLLAEGWPAQAVTKQLADKYSVTLQQARAYTRAGKDLLLDSVGINNRAVLFCQVFTSLQLDRLEAHKNENHTAAVSASKAMVQMLQQLPKMDPMGDFEDQFMLSVAPYLNKGKGSIPRESVDLSEELPF